MIVDRMGLALLAIGAGGIACMMLPEADEPLLVPDTPPSACSSQTFEAAGQRTPDWLNGPQGQQIVPGKLAIEAMRGPFLTLGHACATCVANQATVSAPFQASTIIGGPHVELAVQVGGLWYVRRLGEANHATLVPQLIDLAPAPGAELIVTMTTDATDTRVICGVGPSGVPSCAQLQLGASDEFEGTLRGFGTHLRLDTSCDGTAVLTGWRTRAGRCGDPFRMWIHERVKLAFL